LCFSAPLPRIPHFEIGGLSFHIFQKRAGFFQKRQKHLDLVRFSRIHSDSLGFSEEKIPKLALISRKLALIFPRRVCGREAGIAKNNPVIPSLSRAEALRDACGAMETNLQYPRAEAVA
jgi:hypothetical protein